MNRSRCNPDAYDEIRNDAPGAIETGLRSKLEAQAARIAELEAQLADAVERERKLARIVADLQYEMNPLNARVECIRCGVDYTETHHVDCDIQNALAAAQQDEAK